MPAKPWLGEYPPGVPAQIDLARYESLVTLLESSFERHAALPAFSNLGTTLTFADVERQSRAFAAYLQSLPTLRRGDRVAITAHVKPGIDPYVMRMMNDDGVVGVRLKLTKLEIFPDCQVAISAETGNW